MTEFGGGLQEPCPGKILLKYRSYRQGSWSGGSAGQCTSSVVVLDGVVPQIIFMRTPARLTQSSKGEARAHAWRETGLRLVNLRQGTVTSMLCMAEEKL